MLVFFGRRIAPISINEPIGTKDWLTPERTARFSIEPIGYFPDVERDSPTIAAGTQARRPLGLSLEFSENRSYPLPRPRLLVA